MNMNQQNLEKLINTAVNQNRLQPEQIPDLDLYIDQILMLFEDKLGDTRRREKDKILTKSMVNNYSKERMIRPMKGKKYTREQVLQILMICNLKNMLSIGDIKQVMTTLMEREIDADGLEDIFSRDRVNQQQVLESVSNILSKLKESYSEEMNTIEVVSLIMSLASISGYCKRISEAMIDNFFMQEQEGKDLK